MIREIPDFVADQYAGRRRGFKQTKRKNLRALRRALNDLRMVCAYFPEGATRVDVIDQQIKALEWELSLKSWGR